MFTEHLRPLVESGTGRQRTALVYLTAVKGIVSSATPPPASRQHGRERPHAGYTPPAHCAYANKLGRGCRVPHPYNLDAVGHAEERSSVGHVLRERYAGRLISSTGCPAVAASCQQVLHRVHAENRREQRRHRGREPIWSATAAGTPAPLSPQPLRAILKTCGWEPRRPSGGRRLRRRCCRTRW